MLSIEGKVKCGAFSEVKISYFRFVELVDHTPFCMFVEQ